MNTIPILEAVNKQIANHGEYTPVELLLSTGYLRYVDYENWLAGNTGALQQLMHGEIEEIETCLQVAEKYVRQLGLTAVGVDYMCQTPAKQHIRLQMGGVLERFCRTSFARDADHHGQQQLDLFVDTINLQLKNRVKSALINRQHGKAKEALEKLIERNSDNTSCERLTVLCSAQSEFNARQQIQNPALELNTIVEQLEPVAKQEMGSRKREYLAPFWKRLARVVTGEPFNPENPRLHASWLYRQILDWDGVIDSTENTPGWRDYPQLVESMIEAYYMTRRRQSAIAEIWYLCWHHHAESLAFLNDRFQLDMSVNKYWRRFTELDDLLEIDLFPAFCLLCEPGLLLLDKQYNVKTEEPVFTLVKTLLSVKNKTDHTISDQIIGLRRKLQMTCLPIFTYYMSLKNADSKKAENL